VPTYRIYFRDQQDAIIGRDDYAAADDEHALVIARTLRNACADLCARIELWQGVRRVDAVRPNPSALSLSEILVRTERDEPRQAVGAFRGVDDKSLA
jgi:hypothetical protein